MTDCKRERYSATWCGPHREVGIAPVGYRRTGHPGPRQADHRQVGRGRRGRDPASHRRTALLRPGPAQRRRHEVRPGDEHLRSGVARRGGRPIPGGTHQAAGGRAADEGGDRRPGHDRAVRAALAHPFHRVRRRTGRGGEHRSGPPRGLGGRPRGRRQAAVPRGRACAHGRLQPAVAVQPAVRAHVTGHGCQTAARRAEGAHRRGTGLRARSRQPAGIPDRIRLRPEHPGATHGGQRPQSAGVGVDRRHSGGADHHVRHHGTARPRVSCSPCCPSRRRNGPGCCTPTPTRGTSG